jgi:hypothetical protein
VPDATADIVTAADELARAIARATPAELAAADARLGRLALPAPSSANHVAPIASGARERVHDMVRQHAIQHTVSSIFDSVFGEWGGPLIDSALPSGVLRAPRIPDARSPSPSVPPALLMTVALALVARIMPRPTWSTRARALLAKLR